MSFLIVPRPHPGCHVCGELMQTWIAVTEPASPDYSPRAADLLAAGVNTHRIQDEENAPAL